MKMKAGIFYAPGDVRIEEVDRPECTPGSVIVKNVRAGVCGTDIHAYTRNGDEVGIHAGCPFGHEMCGVIEEADPASGFVPGTRVFVNPVTFREPKEGMSAIESCSMAGAYSQYVKIEKPVEGYNLYPLPDGITWDVAAMIEPISVALNAVLLCNPKPGQKAVIYGGGIIGLAALACLKYLGVEEVIVTARNPFRMAKVEEMGGILCDTNRYSIPEFVIGKWGSSKGNPGDVVWNADIAIECAGYPGAMSEMINYAKQGSYVSLVALSTEPESFTEMRLVDKACYIVGSFTYTPEVAQEAVRIAAERPDLFEPMITDTFGLTELSRAFEEGKITSKNLKVLIDHSR